MRPRRVACLVAVGLTLAHWIASPPARAQQPTGDAPAPAAPPEPPAPAAPGPAPSPASPPPSPSPSPAPPPASGLPAELAPTATTGPSKPKDEKARDEGEGSRLTELFWVTGEIGPSYANMRQFSAENLAIQNPSGGGMVAGVGAGLRLVIVSLGFKLRWHKLSPFNLVQANGELLFKLPISKVDVLIGGHGGYSGVGGLGELFGPTTSSNSALAASDVSVKGWNAGIDVGFDYFLNNYLSFGLGITGDFLSLQRPKSGLPAGFSELPAEVQAEYTNSDVYKYDGKSLGFGVAGALRIGLHLGP